MIRVSAPAKLNLALHVTGQRADGYHLLDSLVVFAVLGDGLSIAPAPKLSLAVTGPMADGVPTGPDNLILRAAALLSPDLTAAITLDKHLPHAAGLGGGSADAAAALRGLARLLGCALPDMPSVLTLGADVPVCLSSSPQRMQGIGEVLSPLPPLPPLWAVLVNPRVAVPTGAVFNGLASKRNPAMTAPHWTGFDDFIRWLSEQRNDLEPPALTLAPEIGQTLAALQDSGAALSRMSGSGATCFGLYQSAAQAADAARRIADTQPGWWVQDTEIQTG
ncbi:4-(cytidine 5'-diphospho)-2-C-methyl-D-erythritol kinase [Nioella aestuarii]|uniref:4-(cytidine 5'-diphospho)-2-C-methyl-D-erythritol kinase n=1 Tax=Nioella aestuarii TaxID=1662864 RepID=UPI003D7FB92E